MKLVIVGGVAGGASAAARARRVFEEGPGGRFARGAPVACAHRGGPPQIPPAEAARRALNDAGIAYDSVQQAYAGYVYADSTAGQRALYPLGMTGIPIVNVNNNCSTG